MMVIKIANLSDGEHIFEFNENVSVIGVELPFQNILRADVKLTKSHSQIILNADIELPAEFECDRCTIKYKTKLNTSYQLVYLFSRENIHDESDDVIYLNPDADVIDISKEVRDYALLAVPMKKLCIESCKGLCYNCGKDLNTGECGCPKKQSDPRWESLLQMKKISINN